jgi:hypothetical protein
MRRLKATMLYRGADRTVVLIEALEVFQYRETDHLHFLASLKPVAIVVSGPDGTTTLGLDGHPTELGTEARTLLEDVS